MSEKSIVLYELWIARFFFLLKRDMVLLWWIHNELTAHRQYRQFYCSTVFVWGDKRKRTRGCACHNSWSQITCWILMLQDKAHHSDFNSCLLFVHFGSTSYNAATKDQGLHCLKIQKQKTFGGKATEPQFNCTHWLLPTLGGKKNKRECSCKGK